MRKPAAFLLALFVPVAATSATLLAAPENGRALIRASAGEIAVLDAGSLRHVWTGPGVRNPKLLVVSGDGRWAAAVDPILNKVAIADLSGATSRVIAVPETPIAAAFHEGALLLLSRDAALLTRIDPADASMRSVDVPAASSHLLVTPRGAIAYAALTGEAAHVDAGTLALLARRALPRFGSDLVSDGASGYLVEPRRGRLTVFSLETLAIVDERAAGAVPVDVEIEAPANAARGAKIAIADPSSKRIWRDEGAQSTAAAVGRGFLRGLLSLGLYNPGSTAFPAGVDRIAVIGGRIFALDSSTGTLFLVRGERATALATGIVWGAFAVAGDALWVARATSTERVSLP